MKCTKCNKENEAEAKFCRYCGASMSAKGPSRQEPLFDVGSSQPAGGSKAAPSNDSQREDVLGWYRYAEIAVVVIVALLITGGVLLAANQVRSRREAASLWAKAWDYSRLGEPDKAAMCAQEIMDKYPSTQEAASARESKPEWDEAYAEQQRQLRIAAAEKEKQMRIAAFVRETESLRDKGQLDEAAASIEQALMLDANHSRVRGLQVEVQVLIEQRRVQAEKEKKFADLCTSATGYAGRGDYEKAVGDYASALEIKPDDAQVIDKLAQCRHDLYFAKGAKAEKDGYLDAAIDDYKTALTHRQTASTQAAMDSAKQAIEKRTEEKRQDFEKLMAEAAAADPNKAGEPLSQALKLYPDVPRAIALKKTIIDKLMDCARTNDSAANGQKALTALEEILKLDPSNGQALALKTKIDGYYVVQSSTSTSSDTPNPALGSDSASTSAPSSAASASSARQGMRGMGMSTGIWSLLTQLDLSDEQRTKIDTIRQASMEQMRPSMEPRLTAYKKLSRLSGDVMFGRSAGMGRGMGNSLLAYIMRLDLSGDVKVKIDKLKQELDEQNRSIGSSMNDATIKLMDISYAGGSEYSIRSAADEFGRLTGNRYIASARIISEARSLLTREQRARVDEFIMQSITSSDQAGSLNDGRVGDEAAIRTVAAEVGRMTGDQYVLLARTTAEVKSLLTYEQRTKLDELNASLSVRRRQMLEGARVAGYAEPSTDSESQTTSQQPVTADTSRKSDDSSPVAPFVGVWGEKWADISASGNIEIKDEGGRPKVTMSGWRVWDEKIEGGSLSFRIKGGSSSWEFLYTATPVYDIMRLDVYRLHDNARFTGQLTK